MPHTLWAKQGFTDPLSEFGNLLEPLVCICALQGAMQLYNPENVEKVRAVHLPDLFSFTCAQTVWK